jgi:hypothetical protein
MTASKMGNLLCFDWSATTHQLSNVVNDWLSETAVQPSIDRIDLTTPLDPPENQDRDQDRNRNPADIQQQCYRTLQELFPQHRFRRCCPPFLLNSDGTTSLGPIELDLYCSELGVAVEYRDRYHYIYDPAVHHSIDDFQTLQRRDIIKQALCMRHDVRLVVIPYTIDDIPEYLTSRLGEIFGPTPQRENPSTQTSPGSVTPKIEVS